MFFKQLSVPLTFFKQSSTKLIHQWFIGSQNVASANSVPKFWIISIYFLILTSCFFGTIINFVCSDFSIYNTFITSTADVPLFYKISATWSNHEGSLLLWCWLLSFNIFLFCVSINKKMNSINTLRDQSFSSLLLNQQLLTRFQWQKRKMQKTRKAFLANLLVIFNQSDALTKNQQKELVLCSYATITGGPTISWFPQNCQNNCIASFGPTNLCNTKSINNKKKTLLFQDLNLLEQQLDILAAMVKHKFFKHLFWDRLTFSLSNTSLKSRLTAHRHRFTEKLSFLLPFGDSHALTSFLWGEPFSNLKATGLKKEPIGAQIKLNSNYEIKQTRAFSATRLGFEQQGPKERSFVSAPLHLSFRTFDEERSKKRSGEPKVDAFRALYITNVLRADEGVCQPLNHFKASMQFKYLELITKTIFIISIILLFFTTFLVYTSNPFIKIVSAPCIVSLAELNPILQDPVLAIHPPCIYTGYVASAIAFSLSLFYWKRH
jgi:hypothetical protein